MAFQLKSGHKLVDFFKNAGKKIKAANAAGGGFKKFQADAAKMRKTGKSKYQLDQMDAAQARKDAKNNKNHPDIDKIGQ
jgi:hypothetical protein